MVVVTCLLPCRQDEDAVEIIPEGSGGDAKGRITTKFMTKYERARVLGTRALQLRHGANVTGVVVHAPSRCCAV